VEREVAIGGKQVPIFDLMGRDATLFDYATDDDGASHGTRFVESAGCGSTRSGTALPASAGRE
jgi:hypothetical protein